MATPTAEPATSTDWRGDFLRKLNNREKADGHPLRTAGLLVTVTGTSLAPVEAACAGQRWNRCLTARYALTGKPAFGTLLQGFAEDLSKLTAGAEPTAKLTARDDRAWADYARRAHPRLRGTGNDLGSLRNLLEAVGGRPGEADPPLRSGERLVLLAQLAETAFDFHEWQTAQTLFLDLPERVVVVLSDRLGRLQPPAADDGRVHSFELPPQAAEEHGTWDGPIVYSPGALAADVPAAYDQLGLERHFTALARLLLHRDTGRLTLAIEGAWGMGKSSFMRFLEDTMVEAVLARRRPPPKALARAYVAAELARHERDELAELRDTTTVAGRDDPRPQEMRLASPDDDATTRHIERTRAKVARAAARLRIARRRAIRDDLVILDFNPWGYHETGQIWAGLAHRLTSQLRDMLTRRERVALRIRYARRRKASELWTAAIAVVLAAVLVVVAALQGVGSTKSGSSGILYAGGFVLLALVFVRAVRGTKPVVDWLSEQLRPRDHRTAMGYQHEVIQDLRFYADGVRRGREECRLIVFIDDLDRCSDEQILEFLGAINLVLVSSGFYVVLGIDTRMIRDAIRERYEGKEIELGKDVADAYLEKIVQIAYRVPVADAAQRYGSVSRLFSATARGALESRRARDAGDADGGAAVLGVDLHQLAFPGDTTRSPIAREPVEDTADELEVFLELQSLLPANPRELKRMVNVHRLAKMLLQAELMEWPREQQRLLVRWLVLCFRWPDAVRRLLAELTTDATGADDVLANLRERIPDAEVPLLDAVTVTDRPTIGEIRNLGLDSVVELCGVLPTARDAGTTGASAATNGAGPH